MDSLQRLLIERECERLVVAFCHYADHGEAQRIADLFTADGVWTAPGVVAMVGREQLLEGLGARQAKSWRTSRHVCSTLRLEVLDVDHAEGVVYVTIYRYDGHEGEGPCPLEGPLMVGEYRDRFVRTTDGWRFARREVSTAFVRPR